jgi:hypothetical protein
MRCGFSKPPAFPGLTAWAYAYLLGQYLGDGCITRHPKDVFRLQIIACTAYPRLIEEVAAAMCLVMPASKVSRQPLDGEGCTLVNSYSKHWPHLFPQHGPGMKHTRPIALADWQREICDRYPARLIRGLIHSDGCRSINTIKHPKRTYRYPRYQFSNVSDDIRGIFCEYLDLLGIEWRRMNACNISVARRASVAELDRLVGPKR